MQIIEKHWAAKAVNKRWEFDQGGTRSGKTYSNLQFCASYALHNDGVIVSIIAESLPHLKRGCLRQFKTILVNEGWDKLFIENKTDHIFTRGTSIVEFFSVETEGKVRGPERDILFANECNHIRYDTIDQLATRTLKRIICDYNPSAEFWAHHLMNGTNPDIPPLKPEDFVLSKSTYLDNPYLLPATIAEIERHKSNSNWWRVFGEGETGMQEGIIFNNWSIVDEMPGKLIGYGMDFGFVNSKTAIIQLNEYSGELYVDELFYEVNASNEKILTFAQNNIILTEQTVADSAEPKTIEFFYSKGWRGIRAAVKGADSVINGISQLCDRKINITRRSTNVIKEFREYMWDSDRTGKPLNAPVKENDHAIDALRYVYTYPKKRQLLFA